MIIEATSRLELVPILSFLIQDSALSQVLYKKMTGETPQVRSEKRKQREEREERGKREK